MFLERAFALLINSDCMVIDKRYFKRHIITIFSDNTGTSLIAHNIKLYITFIGGVYSRSFTSYCGKYLDNLFTKEIKYLQWLFYYYSRRAYGSLILKSYRRYKNRKLAKNIALVCMRNLHNDEYKYITPMIYYYI